MTDRAMKAFLDSCGTDGPLLLGVDEPGASGTSWRVLDQPYAVVGRDPGSDIVLQDPGVSRRHAYLQVIAGRLFCVDLESRTGTRWGGETGLWGWVHPGEGVGIGPFRVRARDASPGSRPALGAGGSALPVPISRSFEQPDLPDVAVQYLGRTAGAATWRANRSLILIGSSSACKVRLQGGSAAPIHASLLRTPAGVFAVDLAGPGGILVNGERARCALLGEDDELGVGKHRFRVRSGPSAGSPAATTPGSARGGGPSAFVEAKAAAAAGEVESLARAMIGEFGRVQERSADRSRELLDAVLDAFAGMHREQMGMIREELARLRELDEEQHLLRARAGAVARAVASSPSLRLVAGEPRAAIGGTSSSPAFAPARSTSGTRNLSIKDAGDAGRPLPAVDRPPPPAAGPGDRPPDGADQGEFHSRIFDRLSEIQGERQGRWRRLVDSVLGPKP